MAKTLPSLPNEIWAQILANLCHSEQRPDAWISYRNVSKAFKESIELIFREEHLPKTWIVFDKLGDYENVDGDTVQLITYGSLSRISDDKTLAIFTIEPSDEKYHDILRERLKAALEAATFEQPCHYVQVRHDVNDTPVPALSINYNTFELTCDWRGLYTHFFGEEYLYNQRTLKWVKEKESWVEDLKKQMQKGELDMLATLEKAMFAFTDGSLESRKAARRVRIRRQYKEDGDAWDFTRNGDKSKERVVTKELEKARKMAALEQFSDDDSGDDEEEEEEDDDDDDNVEDDEWEDDDEEDIASHVEDGEV